MLKCIGEHSRFRSAVFPEGGHGHDQSGHYDQDNDRQPRPSIDHVSMVEMGVEEPHTTLGCAEIHGNANDQNENDDRGQVFGHLTLPTVAGQPPL